MKDICCIGHITKDKIVTPRSTVYMSGGTSYYFAHAIRHLPDDISFSLITAMNPSDAQPVEELRQNGIDVTLLPSRETVFFENIYGDNSNDRRQRVRTKADSFTKEQLRDVHARVFHLGTLLNDDFTADTIAYLATRGRISIDIQGYLREVRNQEVFPKDWEGKTDVLKNTYYIKVNETEMETITGCNDTHKAALLLNSWGVKEVCITLGSEGSLIYTDGIFYDIPAYPPHEVMDATGCGDTYSAGYLYCRMKGMDPAQSGRFAAAMCTLKLEHSGPFDRSMDEVSQLIAQSGR